jgi:hypothetical protein
MLRQSMVTIENRPLHVLTAWSVSEMAMFRQLSFALAAEDGCPHIELRREREFEDGAAGAVGAAGGAAAERCGAVEVSVAG